MKYVLLILMLIINLFLKSQTTYFNHTYRCDNVSNQMYDEQKNPIGDEEFYHDSISIVFENVDLAKGIGLIKTINHTNGKETIIKIFSVDSATKNIINEGKVYYLTKLNGYIGSIIILLGIIESNNKIVMMDITNTNNMKGKNFIIIMSFNNLY